MPGIAISSPAVPSAALSIRPAGIDARASPAAHVPMVAKIPSAMQKPPTIRSTGRTYPHIEPRLVSHGHCKPALTISAYRTASRMCAIPMNRSERPNETRSKPNATLFGQQHWEEQFIKTWGRKRVLVVYSREYSSQATGE